MAEKKRPHLNLRAIKSDFSTTKALRVTGSAMRDAAALGFDAKGIVKLIQTIMPGHFYKSMTANHNAKAWQDVYHVPSEAGVLYVKFTDNGVDELALLSFKAK